MTDSDALQEFVDTARVTVSALDLDRELRQLMVADLDLIDAELAGGLPGTADLHTAADRVRTILSYGIGGTATGFSS